MCRACSNEILPSNKSLVCFQSERRTSYYLYQMLLIFLVENCCGTCNIFFAAFRSIYFLLFNLKTYFFSRKKHTPFSTKIEWSFTYFKFLRIRIKTNYCVFLNPFKLVLYKDILRYKNRKPCKYRKDYIEHKGHSEYNNNTTNQIEQLKR